MDDAPGTSFKLCPQCGRAVPASAPEQFCPNDGQALLSCCPRCQAPIASPYARYCTRCGATLMQPREAP